MKEFCIKIQSCNFYIIILLFAEIVSQNLDWENPDFDIFVKLKSTKHDTTQNDVEDNKDFRINADSNFENPSKDIDSIQINSESLPSSLLTKDGIRKSISKINTEANGIKENGASAITYETDNREKWNENLEMKNIEVSNDISLTSSYSSLHSSPQPWKNITKRNSRKKKRKIRKRPGKIKKNSKKMKPIKYPQKNWLPIENEIRSSIENDNEEMIGVFKVKRKEINFASPFSKRSDQTRNILESKTENSGSLSNEIKGNEDVKTFILKNIVNNQSDKYEDRKNDTEIESEFVESSYRNTYVPAPLHYPLTDNIYHLESSRLYTVSNTIKKDPSEVKAEVIGPSELGASSFALKPGVYGTAMDAGEYSILPSIDVTPTSKSENQKGENIEIKENIKNLDEESTYIDLGKEILSKYKINKLSLGQYENSILDNPLSESSDNKGIVVEFTNDPFYYDENPLIHQESILRRPRTYHDDSRASSDLFIETGEKTGTNIKQTGPKLSKIVMKKNALTMKKMVGISAGRTALRPSLSSANPQSISESPVYPATFVDQTEKHTDNPELSLPAGFPTYKSVASENEKRYKVQKARHRKNVNVELNKTGKEREEGKSTFGSRKQTGKYNENGQIFEIEGLEEEKNGNREETQGKLEEENGREGTSFHVVLAGTLPRNDIALEKKKAIKNILSRNSNLQEISALGFPRAFDISPTFATIPKTSFNCRGKLTGYYADPEAACQVFHRCQQMGRSDSFLCPNGTLFNQLLLTCDYYMNVDCRKAEKYYKDQEFVHKSHLDLQKEDMKNYGNQILSFEYNNLVDSSK